MVAGTGIQMAVKVSDAKGDNIFLGFLADKYAMQVVVSDMMYRSVAAVGVGAKSAATQIAFQKSQAENGSLSHMFDYIPQATQGGQGLDPRRPLWETVIEPAMGTASPIKTINYVFLESRRPVPPVTLKHDGATINDVHFSQSRQYLFKKKAEVIEMGVTRHISPKSSKALFIPIARLKDGQMTGDNEVAQQKGYFMYAGTVTEGPTKAAGKFTEFWLQFWNGEGNRMVQSNMTRIWEQFIAKERALAASKGQKFLSTPRALVTQSEMKSAELFRQYQARALTEQAEIHAEMVGTVIES